MLSVYDEVYIHTILYGFATFHRSTVYPYQLMLSVYIHIYIYIYIYIYKIIDLVVSRDFKSSGDQLCVDLINNKQ